MILSCVVFLSPRSAGQSERSEKTNQKSQTESKCAQTSSRDRSPRASRDATSRRAAGEEEEDAAADEAEAMGCKKIKQKHC